MKIKLNIKRYPFYKELVELAISNEIKVFYKEADGSLYKVAEYEEGYQIGNRYYDVLLAGKYVIKGLLPVEMLTKFVEIVTSLPYLKLYQGRVVSELGFLEDTGDMVYGNVTVNGYVEDFNEVINNIEYLKYL